MRAVELVGLVVAACPLALVAWWVTRYVRGSVDYRRSMRQALRVRLGWRRVARMLSLYVVDPKRRAYMRVLHKDVAGVQNSTVGRLVVPRLRIKADPYGVLVRCRTLPGIGAAEWEERTQKLADAWRATRVTVSQPQPGRITVRAVRRDPLTEPTTWEPTGVEPDAEAFKSWDVGRDEWAEPARIRISDVPGMVLSGLPGSGKTSLLGGQLLSRYAPSRRVAFAIFDGKGGGDYDPWQARAALLVEDDLEEANAGLRRLVELRTTRQACIADAKGSRNFWTEGPTEAWPWVVVVIDEAHTFLEEIRGSDQESKARAALTAENRRLVQDLVKKGRSAGFFTILASQKVTGDAVPTSIRDVCPLLASFAQTTAAAAVAALGEDIREYPGCSPVELQGEQYVGVMVTKAMGQRGFTRVRTPLVSDADQERIATATARLQVDPWSLLPKPRLVVAS